MRSKHDLFNDAFMKQMMAQLGRTVKPAADGFLITHEELAKFLEDVARVYSQNWNPDREQDFFVICMLNALFGDPMRHLNLLHPILHEGPRHVFKSHFQGSVEESVNMMKRRRNAATEVLKSLLLSKSQPTYSSSLESEIRRCALSWLEQGQVK